MPLSISDKWIWDFWFTQKDSEYHVFYLQAPKSVGDEALRHWNVSIGHAVSSDLVNWEILPDALAPSQSEDAFDNYTTWTGSIIHHGEVWYLFYTGSRKRESGLVQRIGYATSRDLITWRKNPNNPVIEADPAWYEILDLELWHDQAWRDPWVFQHRDTGQFHALITARANQGPADARGVIGHAVSDDLRTWQVLPPFTAPGRFGQMEVPQLVEMEGLYYLFFSVPDTHYARNYLSSLSGDPLHGSHYAVGDDPLGPFRYLTDEFLVGDRAGSLYSSKLIQDPTGAWVLMAFRNYAPDGTFIGELGDPIPVGIRPDGRLYLEC